MVKISPLLARADLLSSSQSLKKQGDGHAHLYHLRNSNYGHGGPRWLLPPREGCDAGASKAWLRELASKFFLLPTSRAEIIGTGGFPRGRISPKPLALKKAQRTTAGNDAEDEKRPSAFLSHQRSQHSISDLSGLLMLVFLSRSQETRRATKQAGFLSAGISADYGSQ